MKNEFYGAAASCGVLQVGRGSVASRRSAGFARARSLR